MKKFNVKKKKSIVERDKMVAAVREIVKEKITESYDKERKEKAIAAKKAKKEVKHYVNYINHNERQLWLQMVFLGKALDELIENNVNYGEARTNLKKAKTYMTKAIDGMGTLYPKQIRAILNDYEYFSMLMMPREGARKHYDKFIEKELLESMNDPLEQLYEVLDTSLPLTCKGCCKIGSECHLNSILNRYKIPCMDEHDKLCQFRY